MDMHKKIMFAEIMLSIISIQQHPFVLGLLTLK